MMGVFYMFHFVHGTKVAISDAEVAHDKEHGWVQYEPLAPPDPSTDEEFSNALTPKRRYNRKPKE